MCEIVEVINIKKEEGKECLISQLIETLSNIKEKYGDIEIIHSDSDYTGSIIQIGILKSGVDSYLANISFYGYDEENEDREGEE